MRGKESNSIEQEDLIKKHEEEMTHLTAEHKSEMKQLYSQFEQKMKEKEGEFEKMFSEAYAKSRAEEERTAAEIQRLQSLLEGHNPHLESIVAEKDRQLHDIIAEYEEKLNSSGELLKQRETELLAQIALLQENITFNKSASESPQGSPPYNSHVSTASTPVPRSKKAVHFSDDLHTVDLNSTHSTSENHSTTVLAEPTELEYLKNVLYEYMMGKQTQTLAKVIASVMKFSKEQTINVITKEEEKMNNSWLMGS
ncbi:GOLGA4 [Bugula neritina]|uniref:GOLGA4 n=1 Tax=Bugula neritina TaxID=10212 RepID=A0A7J7JUC2_BUGNE|nr:GOLGA4 [Bugula neritina]